VLAEKYDVVVAGGTAAAINGDLIAAEIRDAVAAPRAADQTRARTPSSGRGTRVRSSA
jgi:hypothetical protein